MRAALVLLFVSLCATAEAQPAAKPPEKPPELLAIDMKWGVKIPMRDGVRLNATVFLPADRKGPLPVVFTLTPYIADNYQDRASYFATHGYVFALVDARGRGNSGGRFDPFFQEPRDGHDIVEWLARQPYSNGKVAMWGGSYAGFNQWLTARERPPHLASIVPVASPHVVVDFPAYKNIFHPYAIRWLTLTSGATDNAKLFGERGFWRAKFIELFRSHRPFRELDEVVGNDSTPFENWIAHPTMDAYWQRAALTPEQYRALTLPILTITGAYDGDQPGALHYYRQHMRFGSPRARANHFLIIGPWDHPGTRTPQREVSGLSFGEASLVDLNGLHKEWYDWTMKGGPRPGFLKKRVAYYVIGADEWRHASSLDVIGRQKRTFYLDSRGQASSVFRSGDLRRTPPTTAGRDSYTYDPLDVRSAERVIGRSEEHLTDQLDVMAIEGDGLVYHSEPFAQDTVVSGSPRLTVWMAMDVPDTDIAVDLYEITQDGQSISLGGDMVRARYRDSLLEEELVVPGQVNRYVFDGFDWFSRRIPKGSRLRLVISAPNNAFVQKNYNSGGVVAAESGKDARTAHVTLYHDAQRPSALELPIDRASEVKAAP